MDIRQVRRQRQKVDELRERIICIQADIERTTAVIRAAAGNGYATDTLASQMAKLVDLQQQLTDEAILLQYGISEAESVLDALPEQQAKVIRLRYIEGLKWWQVAQGAGFSESSCKRINKVALKKIVRNDTY